MRRIRMSAPVAVGLLLLSAIGSMEIPIARGESQPTVHLMFSKDSDGLWIHPDRAFPCRIQVSISGFTENGWGVDCRPPEMFFGSTSPQRLDVAVRVPPGTLQADYCDVTVTARATFEGLTSMNHTHAIAVPVAHHGGMVRSLMPIREVSPGGTVLFGVVVWNNGTATGTYQLEISTTRHELGDGRWLERPAPEPFRLLPSQHRIVRIPIRVPADRSSPEGELQSFQVVCTNIDGGRALAVDTVEMHLFIKGLGLVLDPVPLAMLLALLTCLGGWMLGVLGSGRPGRRCW